MSRYLLGAQQPRKRYGGYLAGLVLPLLCSCASSDGIAPHAQMASIPAMSNVADKTASAPTPPVSEQWWRAFTDPQLDSLIAQMTQLSPTLQQAVDRIHIAQAQLGAVSAIDQPKLNARGSLGVEHWPQDTHYGAGLNGDTTWNNTAGLAFDYDIDLFQRQDDRDQRALAQLAMSDISAQAAQLQLTANIVRSYIQLALAYDQLDVQRKRLKQQQEIINLTQAQFDYGLGSRYDLQQAEAQLPVIKSVIRGIDERIALNKNQLVTLVGLPLQQSTNIQRPTLTLASNLDLPTNLPLSLIGNRPDINASRWRIVAQARSIDLAKADFYPDINLMAGFSQVMTVGSLSQIFSAQNRSYSVGPAISLPIFDGGARRAQLGIASASYDEVVHNYNATLQQALREVSDVLIQQRSAQDQALLADEAVARANQVFKTAETAFKQGFRDYLHVLDAQTRLLEQELVRANVHARLLTVEADLAIALGGGIKFSAPTELQLLPTRVHLASASNGVAAAQITEELK
ncbi:efflux transporter outer membrane subunit [Shewanella avicenniae]|uniref:Efflux transporter outer membrane subunit n=1 Tax=Shewanella avicenniae TaxID=2814294 RepID=A0ABX7QTI7_9GAMM|nr:efflux transporter outer membrane subunit [Shewanella avicenniae]QSX34802.1 efflux transporter outer membrane subunit [Shewanella avicenniae]